MLPNLFPSKPAPRRIAIVADVVNQHKDWYGKTLVTHFSPSEHAIVAKLLAGAGVDIETCFVGCCCATPVPGNKADRIRWTDAALVEGIEQLKLDLAKFQPDFVLLLGNIPLRLFKGEKASVDNWRGSLFMSGWLDVDKPVKCLATYHPRSINIDYGLTGVARFDYVKLGSEHKTDGLDVPVDYIEINLTKNELVDRLSELIDNPRPVAIDLEGWPDRISCYGFADGPNHAFVVPFMHQDGTSWWTNEQDEVELWEMVKLVLEAQPIVKIAHNALYELFVSAWSYGVVINNLAHDTMVMHFELYAELEKSLAFCTSIYTKHPYYKSERKSTDDTVALLYNGKDCCRTYEIWQAMTPKLALKQREHYQFNMSLLVPLAYMSLRGIRYDKAEAERRLAEVQQSIYEKQDEINQEAAKHESRQELRSFYEALGQSSGSETAQSVLPADPNRLPETPTSQGRNRLHEVDPRLIQLFTTAFCRARCVESVEVEETSWQRHLWDAHARKPKWKRTGKRLKERPTSIVGPETVLVEKDGWLFEAGNTPHLWPAYKIHRKLVTRNQPVAITTLEAVQRFAKDSVAAECKRACRILRDSISIGSVTPDQRGQLATLLGISVKINATGRGRDTELDDGSVEQGAERDANWWLYECCGLPKQFKKEGNKLTDKLSSDDGAVINIYAKTRDPRASLFLKMRKLITTSKFLKAESDADGRIRFGFNLVGTPTGRMAAYGSPTGSSDINPQTWGKPFKDLLKADEGCYIGNFDENGADGFSVAAFAKSLGDSTMMDDLEAGLKVAKIVALMMLHGPVVNTWTREQIREASKAISEEAGPEYPTSKVIQHMSAYGGGPAKMSDQILENSVKKGSGEPIYIEPAKCKLIQQNYYFGRYPGIPRWHDWGARELVNAGQLTICNGFTRKFYGRKTDKNVVNEFLSHTPQAVTTYCILLALSRQWSEASNRREDGSLRVEPLLLVHDSNVSHWRQEDTDYAKTMLREWFKNKVVVAGQEFIIPASGGYGVDWKNTESKL